MLDVDIPTKVVLPFGADAGVPYIRVVPVPDQTGSDPGAASFTTGFPPDTFVPVDSGGIPPDGRDMNGILNVLSAWVRWYNAGGPIGYDAVFAASVDVNGYPKGAVLASATLGKWWISTVDGNTTDPDSGGSGWQQTSINIQTVAGNPNGIVAGQAGGSGLSPDFLYDTVNRVLWVCTTTGTTLSAVWSTIVNERVVYAAGSAALGSASNAADIVTQAPTLVSIPSTALTWNGWNFTVNAQGGAATLAPAIADSVAGLTPGAVYVVAQGQSAKIVGDGAGKLGVQFISQAPGTAPGPQYINESQTIGSGYFNVDTSLGPLTLAITAGLPAGAAITILDAAGTFGANPMTLVRGGGDTIFGDTVYVGDAARPSPLIIWRRASGNWSNT